jgi:hypothetical protein
MLSWRYALKRLKLFVAISAMKVQSFIGDAGECNQIGFLVLQHSLDLRAKGNRGAPSDRSVPVTLPGQ